MTTNEANGAWCRELHARLAKSITSCEVMRRIHVDGNDTLTSLYTSGRSNVLTESASHTLRYTVSTSTGGLLVFPEDMVWKGVDTKGVALCTGFLTDG